jgi:V/A-type H+-transporting ATPase subunit D
MAGLSVSPTKSNLLALKRQLAFAEEGYDLLEQKRQILVFELMSRLGKVRQAERQMQERMQRAYHALHQARLDAGGPGLDRAALAVRLQHELLFSQQPMMGLHLPRMVARIDSFGVQFGLIGTSANVDLAMRCFVEALPVLAELAEMENAVIRLARELRRTQRRCNALSKIFIPAHRRAIAYITSSLEERERESIIILKMIRKRLTRPTEPSQAMPS